MVSDARAGVARPGAALARGFATTAMLREALAVLAGTVFLALTARISVPLPFTPVPVTGQTLGVLLVGALYGPRRGALTVLAYIAEGLAGAPVFAGGRSGLPVLLGPTGGYLVGFVPAAFIAGLGSGRRSAALRLGAIVVATVVVYVVGVPWLALAAGMPLALAAVRGLLPFLLGDALKAAITVGVSPAGAQMLRRARIAPW